MGVYNIDDKSIFELAIASILNQTYKNFEFIICDDGSNSRTSNLLKSLVRSDSRIVLLRNETNKGLAFSLNKCIENAKGQYIARMDADDVSLLYRFEQQVDFLNKNLEYAFVGTNVFFINDHGRWGGNILPEYPDKKSFLFNSPFVHPTVMMRKEVLLNVNGYKVEKITRRAEDYDLWMRMYTYGYKGYNMQGFLYEFREDQNAYRRRAYKYRFDEVQIRYRGFKQLGMLPKAWPYVIKPLIVGLIPQRLLAILRQLKYKYKLRG